MDNKKKLLLMEKAIYFEKTKIIKINDIYKGSSFQILYYCQFFYTKNAVTDDRIQPSWFENIWLQRYEVLINEIWRKKNQNGTSNFRICVKHDSPRHRKMCFFKWDCLSYYRSL